MDPSTDADADTRTSDKELNLSLYPDALSSAGRWLTVSELAAKRRISEASAGRLVRRNKWKRRTDADGRMSVLVPERTADTPNRPRGSQPAIEVLRMAVESLTERLRIADADVRRERGRADKAEADVRIAQDAAERARASAQAAHGRVFELEQAEAARRAQGRWARLRRAWRGE